MRNGNIYNLSYIIQYHYKFLPYLWGMETYLSTDISVWLKEVLTVPMRNGNFLRIILPLSMKIVLTVPMRNGNWSDVRSALWCTFVLTVPMRNGNRMQLTFQQLDGTVLTVPMRNGNMANINIKVDVQKCSYRTYEEWKLLLSMKLFLYSLVLTVPMRNGNGE